MTNEAEPFLKDEELITNAEVELSEEVERLQKKIIALNKLSESQLYDRNEFLEKQIKKLWDWLDAEKDAYDEYVSLYHDYGLGGYRALGHVESKMKELGLDALPLSKGE